jgi:hypothetical protein
LDNGSHLELDCEVEGNSSGPLEAHLLSKLLRFGGTLHPYALSVVTLIPQLLLIVLNASPTNTSLQGLVSKLIPIEHLWEDEWNALSVRQVIDDLK